MSAETTGRTFVVRLPDAPPLSLNQREHHMRRSKRTREWREAAAWCAKAERLPRLDRCHVTLVGFPPDRRKRDLDNLTATLKPCVDGLVDAGVIEDDDASIVTGFTVSLSERSRSRRWEWWLHVAEVDS